MGLDTIELIMEMEGTFGIVIPDPDAGRIGTVGQAYRYILNKLELRPSSPCPSASLFYRLRRALVGRSGADRRAVRPSARIGDFLPESGRRVAWRGVGRELGLALPRLALAPWQARLAIGIGLANGALILAAGAAVDGITLSNLAVAVTLMSLFAALGWAAAHRSLILFASTLPPGCETVGGTVEAILGRHGLTHRPDARTWHRDEVWSTLRELIAEQLGVDRDQITEEKSFVHDFGAD